MSDLSEIVGQDVNLQETAPEQPEQEQETTASPETTSETPAETVETVEEVRAKTVPLAALHEAREKIRLQRQEFDQFKAQQQQREQLIEQRLAALLQAQQPKAPEFDENPAEHLRHQLQNVQQSQQVTAQQIQEWKQAQQIEAAKQQLTQQVVAHEQQFMEQAPDYHDALEHLRQARAREFMAFGADEIDAKRRAVEEMQHHAYWCAANGKDPAALAYQLAQARGYTKRVPAASAADRLQVQQRGVAASRSLGGGGAATGKTSVEALLAMSDDDFASATKGNNWQKLMGG